MADDFEALFQLPLDEFTGARNALAARLKKTGQADEAQRVKALAKPSVSAWAVNQLYWLHQDTFIRLIATGERFARAQASQGANKTADLRAALDERREALSDLSRLAAEVLRNAGHNPSLDTIRRVTTTLEALSTSSSSGDGPRAGYLTEDVGPPGFDSLAAFMPTTAPPASPERTGRVLPFKPPASPGVSKREEARLARVTAAKATLEAAERALHETQSMAQELADVLKEATAHADELEKNRREAAQRLEKANAAAEEARQRLRTLTAEAQRTAKLLENAGRAVAKAQEDLNNVEKL